MSDPSTTQTPPAPTTTTTTTDDPSPHKTYTYYHAGPLFTVSDLSTNITLSTLISKHASQTHNIHFSPILPQDLEPRDASAHAIRDADVRALLSCDAALFVYDGAELDAGTVVEYMVAKAADIPAVILRTDFRGGGDQHHVGDGDGDEADRWNLMSSFWPRTRGVRIDSMAGYKARLGAAAAAAAAKGGKGEGVGNRVAAEGLMRETVERVVEALEEVVQMPPRLPKELRGPVYDWLALMPGFKDGSGGENAAWAKALLDGKVQKGLL